MYKVVVFTQKLIVIMLEIGQFVVNAVTSSNICLSLFIYFPPNHQYYVVISQEAVHNVPYHTILTAAPLSMILDI